MIRGFPLVFLRVRAYFNTRFSLTIKHCTALIGWPVLLFIVTSKVIVHVSSQDLIH